MDRSAPSDLGGWLVRYRTRRWSTGLQRLKKFRDLVVARLEHLELITAPNSYQEYGIYRPRGTSVVCLWLRSSQKPVNLSNRHLLFPLRMRCLHIGPSYHHEAGVGFEPNDRWIPMLRLPSWRNQNPGTSKKSLNDDSFTPEQCSM
jgi:hypothetical protein